MTGEIPTAGLMVSVLVALARALALMLMGKVSEAP